MSGLDSGLDSPLTHPIIIYRPNGERVQNGAIVVVNIVKPESEASPQRVQTMGSGSTNGAIVPINAVWTRVRSESKASPNDGERVHLMHQISIESPPSPTEMKGK